MLTPASIEPNGIHRLEMSPLLGGFRWACEDMDVLLPHLLQDATISITHEDAEPSPQRYERTYRFTRAESAMVSAKFLALTTSQGGWTLAVSGPDENQIIECCNVNEAAWTILKSLPWV